MNNDNREIPKKIDSDMDKERDFEVLEDKYLQNFEEENDEILKFEAYGGFFRRLAASILDWLFVVIISTVVGFVSLFSYINTTFSSIHQESSEVIFSIIIFVATIFTVAYNMYYYFKEGKTLGYKILGMQIVSSKTGKLPSSGVLFGRWFSKTAITGTPLGLIGLIVTGVMISANKNKQGPHDMIVNTIVVMEKKHKNNWVVWTTLILLLVLPVLFISALMLGLLGVW